MAHPSLEDYVDHHTPNIGLAPGTPLVSYPVWQTGEIEKQAREDWWALDRRFERRQRQLEREREAEAAPVVSYSADWYAVAACESSGNWAETAGIFEGGLQFLPSTWDAYAPAEYPEAAYLASPAQQMYVAELVLAAQGSSAWPNCFVP
jgi:hypothetical protein